MAVFEWLLAGVAVIVWAAGIVVFFREGVAPSIPFMAVTAVLLLTIRALHGRRARLHGGQAGDGSSL